MTASVDRIIRRALRFSDPSLARSFAAQTRNMEHLLAERAELRAAYKAASDPDTCPNLRDFGWDRHDEFLADVGAWHDEIARIWALLNANHDAIRAQRCTIVQET